MLPRVPSDSVTEERGEVRRSPGLGVAGPPGWVLVAGGEVVHAKDPQSPAQLHPECSLL